MCGEAAQETDPEVPLHLNGVLSGKSNKQNVFKPRSKYSLVQFRVTFLLKTCKRGLPTPIEIFDILKM